MYCYNQEYLSIQYKARVIFKLYHACNQIMGHSELELIKFWNRLKKINYVNWWNNVFLIVYRNLPPPPRPFCPPHVSKLWRRCWVETERFPGNQPPHRWEISPQPTKVRSGKHADISRTLSEVMFVLNLYRSKRKTLYIENTEGSS